MSDPAAPPPPQPVVVSVPTNGYAVASLVLGIAGLGFLFVGPILALVFGYMGRNEIDRSGGVQGGRGLAVAGIVLGWVGIGLSILFLVFFIFMFVFVFPVALREIEHLPTPFITP